jgi:hypothetical protein
MSKLVHGIGTNDGKYPAFKDGKPTKEYDLWKHMLHRCTEKNGIKNPTYDNVSCSKNFKHYSFFYEWIHRQVGFGNKDEKGRCWNLDKDLLVKGNKIYSEDVCVFVPQRINLLLTKRDASRGEYPVGVHRNTGNRKYMSKCSRGASKQTHLGSFNTPQEAFLAYKTFKEALIKEVANEYKEQLDERAYEALMKYEVNVDD